MNTFLDWFRRHFSDPQVTALAIVLGIGLPGIPNQWFTSANAFLFALLAALLLDGIGSTIRVSLTADPVREIGIARRILAAVGLGRNGIDLDRFSALPTREEARRRLDLAADAVVVGMVAMSAPIRAASTTCIGWRRLAARTSQS